MKIHFKMVITSKLFEDYVGNDSTKIDIFHRVKNHFNKRGIKILHTDFDDIYGDSRLELYKKIGTELTSVKDHPLERFFYTICKNQTKKFIRDNKKHTIAIALPPHDDDGVTNEINFDKISRFLTPTPEEEMILSERKARVHEAIDKMSKPCRHLLEMFYIEGYNWAELAGILYYANSESVRTEAYRCRQRLKENNPELRLYLK